jgi:hypothetical protein
MGRLEKKPTRPALYWLKRASYPMSDLSEDVAAVHETTSCPRSFDTSHARFVQVTDDRELDLLGVFDTCGDNDVVHEKNQYNYGTDVTGWKTLMVADQVYYLTDTDPYYAFVSDTETIDLYGGELTLFVSVIGQWAILFYGRGVRPGHATSVWRAFKYGPWSEFRDETEVLRTFLI